MAHGMGGKRYTQRTGQSSKIDKNLVNNWIMLYLEKSRRIL